MVASANERRDNGVILIGSTMEMKTIDFELSWTKPIRLCHRKLLSFFSENVKFTRCVGSF